LLINVLLEFSIEGVIGKPNGGAREDPTVGIYIYRSIRLLNDLHNMTFGSIFVPFTKLALLLVLFISTYATIKLRSIMSPVVFGFFLVYVIDAFVLTVPSAVIMSKIFSLSSQFQVQQAQQLNLLPPISRFDVQRQLKSFPALKCQVGSFYHMEGKAKLTLADNMANGIAFMLLSFN